MAGLFATAFVISAVWLMITYFPAKQLLDPNFYKKVLLENNVYQNLPGSISRQLANNLTEDRCLNNPDTDACSTGGNLPAADRQIPLLILDQAGWENILSSLIDPAYLQTEMESLLDQFFYILLDSPDPINTRLSISLQSVKHRLAGPEGTQAFLQLIKAQEPCSLEQLLGLVQASLGQPAEIETLLCQPPADVLETLTPAINSFLAGAVDLAPDQLTFSLPIESTNDLVSGREAVPGQPAIPDSIRYLRWTADTIYLSPLLPLFLLLLVTIFAVRSIKDLLAWWGSSFLAAGLISLLLLFISLLAVDWAIAQLMPAVLDESLELLSMLSGTRFAELFSDLGERLVMTVLVPASVSTTLGILALCGYFLLKRRGRSNSEQGMILPDSRFEG